MKLHRIACIGVLCMIAPLSAAHALGKAAEQSSIDGKYWNISDFCNSFIGSKESVLSELREELRAAGIYKSNDIDAALEKGRLYFEAWLTKQHAQEVAHNAKIDIADLNIDQLRRNVRAEVFNNLPSKKSAVARSFWRLRFINNHLQR